MAEAVGRGQRLASRRSERALDSDDNGDNDAFSSLPHAALSKHTQTQKKKAEATTLKKPNRSAIHTYMHVSTFHQQMKKIARHSDAITSTQHPAREKHYNKAQQPPPPPRHATHQNSESTVKQMPITSTVKLLSPMKGLQDEVGVLDTAEKHRNVA